MTDQYSQDQEPPKQTVPVIRLTPDNRPRKKGFLAFLRRRWLLIAIILGLASVGVFLFIRSRSADVVAYDTATAKRGDLVQTVSVTGAIKSATEFSLNFEAAGRVATTTVAKGDSVNAGQLLASLESTEYSLAAERAKAALSEAQANLSKAIAGASPEEVRVKQAALAQTEAQLKQAGTTLENTRKETALSVATAALNRDKAVADRDAAAVSLEDTKKTKDQGIEKAESTQISDIYGAAVVMDTSRMDMDNILGVDNTLGNDSFESLLGVADPSTLDKAKESYEKARDSKTALDAALNTLPADPSPTDIDGVTVKAKLALSAFTLALGDVRLVLDATPAASQLPLTELNAKRTMIDTDRTNVNVKYTTIVNDMNATSLSRIDRDTGVHAAESESTSAKIRFSQSEQDLAVARLQAETRVGSDAAAVTVTAASRDQAQAALDLTTARLRDVDRAPLEAAVAQARAAAESAVADLSKTEIRAPTDGVVTDVRVNTGELATASTAAVSMLAAHNEIEADVAETDVAKIKVGQAVDVTIDALGTDVHFAGTVLSINPSETVIQDIVYYKMRIVLADDNESVKPGMTANLVVSTAKRLGVITAPLRAVRDDLASRYVEILKDGKTEQRPVVLGLRGDEGLVEIVSGLSEGEEIVVGIKKDGDK